VVNERIVSLLPSATEIVCALGLQAALVGRSHECDLPQGVESLPVCTEPKAAGGDTRAIHSAISSIVRNDISVYAVDGKLLRALRPTHIVTQVQCEVCAASLRDVEQAIAGWSGAAAPRIVALNPCSLDDVFDDIRRTAVALGSDAGPLVAAMRRRMEAVAAETASLPRPRVAVIEWLEPLMAAGNWMPELVALAGGVNVLGEAGKHSGWITWDDLLGAGAEAMVIAPCGFSIADSIRDLPLLTRDRRWRSLPAVRDGRTYIVEGNHHFNRPGPRLAESVEILAEILHGRDYGRRNAWRRCG